ncbi:hypothetical protein G6F43_007875 [Rhizopus delemar]|nr:hypothetical protein G6F43_007875 [Rhizopus delemar]
MSIGFYALHYPSKLNNTRLPCSTDWINQEYIQLTQDVSYMTTHYYSPTNTIAPSTLLIPKKENESPVVFKRTRESEEESACFTLSSCGSDRIDLYELYNQELMSYDPQQESVVKDNRKEGDRGGQERRSRRKKWREMMSKFRLAAERPFVSIDHHFYY